MNVEAQDVKPSKKWFALPALLLVVAAVAITLAVQGLMGIVNVRPNLTLPGNTSIYFEEAGTVDIFYEYVMAYQINEEITFYFEETATGEVIESRPPGMSTNYNINGRRGVLVAQAQLPRPGAYLVTSSYSKAEPALNFVVGRSVLGNLVGTILWLVGGILCFVGSVLGFILIPVIRRNNRRDQNSYQHPYTQ